LHLIAWWHGKKDWPSVLQAIQGCRAKPASLSVFCIKAQLAPGLVFGFAAWTRAQIRQALQECAERL
jgi:hypothetical protein